MTKKNLRQQYIDIIICNSGLRDDKTLQFLEALSLPELKDMAEDKDNGDDDIILDDYV